VAAEGTKKEALQQWRFVAVVWVANCNNTWQYYVYLLRLNNDTVTVEWVHVETDRCTNGYHHCARHMQDMCKPLLRTSSNTLPHPAVLSELRARLLFAFCCHGLKYKARDGMAANILQCLPNS